MVDLFHFDDLVSLFLKDVDSEDAEEALRGLENLVSDSLTAAYLYDYPVGEIPVGTPVSGDEIARLKRGS